MDTIAKIEQIEQDFSQGREPFDDVKFPEQRLLRELPNTRTIEQRLRAVSLFAMFDYNRNASQLVDNLLELHEKRPELYKPHKVPPADEFVDTFETIGFRYANRDSNALQKNAQILLNKYHGAWHELLLSTQCNARRLVGELNKNHFLYLKGDKIAPMYARIIHDEVTPLTNLWDLDIPVDTWVRKISQEIFQEDMTDDEIRERWRGVADDNDINRHIVDGGIWLIGNNLNEWGEEYLKEVTGTETFKHL